MRLIWGETDIDRPISKGIGLGLVLALDLGPVSNAKYVRVCRI